MLELLQHGFSAVFSIQILILITLGVGVGIIFGAVPGLTAVMAIALSLPLTYSMGPAAGLSLLVALYIGATSGGLISAILLKIPGTPSSIATTFDGGPMMEKGEGVKALGAGIVFSFLGTIASIAALMFIAPWLAKVALRFGPHEYFAIAIFSLTLIATLSTGSMIKGLFSGVLGFVFATVGIAPVDAIRRFTFDIPNLNSGFEILTVLVGVFAISEIIKVAESVRAERKAQVGSVSMKDIKGFGFSLKEFFGQLPNSIRSAFIGIGIGILPGVGAGTSNIVSYIVAKKRSKHPEKFGTGVIDGVVASETANNAGIGGAMIPLLTLGIPGDAVTAILLGGFMIHGIQPGPMLFMSQGDLVYTIFAALILAALMMLVLEFYGLRIFIKLLAVPKHILLPIILVLCVVGAFGLSSRIFDIWTILVFGLVGYGFVKGGIPAAPFIIGFILGPMAETNLRRGLMLSDGNFMGFLSNPIAGGFILLAVASVAWHLFNALRHRKDGVVELLRS
ncbi:tripartite tricarboxylate transporter permease [Pseudomonas indica]|uniref:Putative tricarboxylic transport membrane protein n=1 Tax=Pseudomonas indica TaxID=137658 RepID=A0A1G9GU37_9PSED|nr:tripartite tricarboxylate transporter permease [Pseudomonas indica]MBU3058913.1 tripartite tricarboxylate transporter permease [Pseudomonas indica]PAU65445.1 Tat pathway signal protein [Pseudomonas indica]SDL04102.1 putative tricarboxylic transport membrane protein [Pseudomonas indica]